MEQETTQRRSPVDEAQYTWFAGAFNTRVPLVERSRGGLRPIRHVAMPYGQGCWGDRGRSSDEQGFLEATCDRLTGPERGAGSLELGGVSDLGRRPGPFSSWPEVAQGRGWGA